MDFGKLINKGKEALSGKDGKIDYSGLQKDAQDAYKTFNSTDGSVQDKASAVYAGYQKEHSGSNDSAGKPSANSSKPSGNTSTSSSTKPSGNEQVNTNSKPSGNASTTNSSNKPQAGNASDLSFGYGSGKDSGKPSK